MSEKVNEKGLAFGKRCLAFFLGEGFEAAVYQIPRSVQNLANCPGFVLHFFLVTLFASESGSPLLGGIHTTGFFGLFAFICQSRFCR